MESIKLHLYHPIANILMHVTLVCSYVLAVKLFLSGYIVNSQ